ncbi:MAG: SIMPL domain-containing protein [Methylacidiphilaceae bacterium]|nr:SIMPL domain-containing protein [Candidatus Methylacidiphilaceae bacterium]
MSALVCLWIGWAGIGGIRPAWAEPESVRSVRVHAEAEERAPIDRAVVEFVILSEGKLPDDAEKKDEARFAEVQRQVEATLGKKRAWRTSEIRLAPVMTEGKGKREGKEQIAAYRVIRTEAIELAEFSRVGELLAVLFRAGVDEINGVEWISDRVEALYRELLGKAMAKAREKAECLAKASSVQLGPVLSIQEGGGPIHPMVRFRGSAMASALNAPSPVPISGGEMKIQASVQVVYRLW